ncbi:MAG: FkbM family methyltransferase [Blastocatellia bacterium]|nr:FkbM family methyltransferase [Blastocatellia bacterium]
MVEIDSGELHRALQTIGAHETARERMVRACLAIEKDLAQPNHSVRDEVTGCLVDALHAGCGVLRKQLRSGIIFDFLYRSKIARDFVMSEDPAPDHVWEPQTTKLLLFLAQGARHVLVGGAYGGDHAILIAHQLQNSPGLCHAFEPNAEQFGMLLQNARNNGLTNVKAQQLGLWKNDETLLHLVGDDSHAHPEEVAGESAGRPEVFPTISINTYGRQQEIASLDVIMLDIEGGELAALEGATAYLSQPAETAPKIVFEIHRSYTDWSAGLEQTPIGQLLVGFGYHLFCIRDYQSNVPMDGMPVELIPPQDTVLAGPPHGFNMLAVKDVNFVNQDFFRIRHNVSPKLLAHKDPLLHQPL